ncbi:MAG: TolC family protein [Thermodesulfobacteriota bacteirum]|nr:TolC family protein [Thermodesulfobacteriota bacterium]
MDLPNLTLDSALQIAEENNYELTYLNDELDARESTKKQYTARFFPQVKASAIYPFYGRSSAITVDQLIFDFGKLSKRINAGKYMIKALYYKKQGRKHEIFVEVSEKFYRIIKARNLMEHYTQEEKTLLKKVEQSKAFLDAGRISSLELAEASIALGKNELKIIQTRGRMQKLEEEFFILLGIVKPENVTYSSELKYEKIELDSSLITDSHINQFYEIKALEMQIMSTKTNIAAIYRDFLPNLVARAAYRFEGKGVAEEDKDNDLIGGLGATWEIFNGGETYHEIRSQKANLRAQMTKLRLMKQSITSKIKLAVIDADTSFYKIGVYDKAYKASSSHFQYLKSKYNNGEASEVELLEAEDLYKKQKVTYENAIYDYLITVARIEKATGFDLRQ